MTSSCCYCGALYEGHTAAEIEYCEQHLVLIREMAINRLEGAA